jgi:hypothetical protein
MSVPGFHRRSGHRAWPRPAAPSRAGRLARAGEHHRGAGVALRGQRLRDLPGERGEAIGHHQRAPLSATI